MSNSTIKQIEIPTVRNLQEARRLNKDFDSVITAGPSKYEVKDFNHSDHKIVSFADTTMVSAGAPTKKDVLDLISWGSGRSNLLVHCHAGISRSTAIAWGIAIGNGMDEAEAIAMLVKNHPKEPALFGNRQRPFAPNHLIVKHLEEIFRFKDNELINLRNQYATEIW